MEHLAQVEVEVVVAAAVVTINLVEVVGATTVVVVITVLEEVALTEMVVVVGEEDTTEVVVVTVVLMTTVVAEVAVMGVETRKTKGAVKVATMLVAMDKLLHKGLLPTVGLLVTTLRLRAMEATMPMVQTQQCHLLITIVVAQAHTHQAMVPLLQTNTAVVPQEDKVVYHLHMMVAIVVGLCLEVEVLGVHHLLIKVVAAVAAEEVDILVVLLLSQLQRLSSAMKTVMRHVTTQGFTSQTCLQMSLLKNYRSYLEESARYNFILLDVLLIFYDIILLSGIVL